jgi:AcrR family transcriptional regulator
MSVNTAIGKSKAGDTDGRRQSRIRTEEAAAARRVGRPSIAEDRRAQIVEAFLECIRRHGLTGATVERVAEALGFSRTLVFHYFGDTEALVQAAAEQIFDQTLARLMASLRTVPTDERGRAILDFLFAGPHFGELRDVIVMAEITSLAGRDKRLHAMLADMWERSIGIVVDELRAAFPQADPSRCRAIGYALTCLAEENWWMTFIGPGLKRRNEARKAAEILFASLLPIAAGRGRKGNQTKSKSPDE